MAGVRPHGFLPSSADAGQARHPTRSGQGRAPAAIRQRPLRNGIRAVAASGIRARLLLSLADDRIDECGWCVERPGGGGIARRHPRLLRHLVPSRQLRPHAGRRLRPIASARACRPVFRRHSSGQVISTIRSDPPRNSQRAAGDIPLARASSAHLPAVSPPSHGRSRLGCRRPAFHRVDLGQSQPSRALAGLREADCHRRRRLCATDRGDRHAPAAGHGERRCADRRGRASDG